MNPIITCALVVTLHLSNHFPQAVRQWQHAIEAASRETCIDPNLLGAMIWQESRGQANIFGKAGEVGLMQILPRDNKINPAYTQSWSRSTEELLNPSENILYGAYRMRQILAENDHNVRLALALYNCGEMNLQAGKCGRWGGFNYADIILDSKRSYVLEPKTKPVPVCPYLDGGQYGLHLIQYGNSYTISCIEEHPNIVKAGRIRRNDHDLQSQLQRRIAVAPVGAR